MLWPNRVGGAAQKQWEHVAAWLLEKSFQEGLTKCIKYLYATRGKQP